MSGPKSRSSKIQSGSAKTTGRAPCCRCLRMLLAPVLPIPPASPAEQMGGNPETRLSSPPKGPRTQATPIITAIGNLSLALRTKRDQGEKPSRAQLSRLSACSLPSGKEAPGSGPPPPPGKAESMSDRGRTPRAGIIRLRRKPAASPG
jgi:hypothetical protein